MWFRGTRKGSVYKGAGDSQGVGFIGGLFFTLTHTNLLVQMYYSKKVCFLRMIIILIFKYFLQS